MRQALHLALFAQALLATPVFRGELIKQVLHFNDMRVVVTYVSTGGLVKLQARYGAHIDRRDNRQSGRHGVSILRKSRETGTPTCEIYLPNERRPREVADEATLILGHELLHCMHGDYHR
jgi:hypothetical protein